VADTMIAAAERSSDPALSIPVRSLGALCNVGAHWFSDRQQPGTAMPNPGDTGEPVRSRAKPAHSIPPSPASRALPGGTALQRGGQPRRDGFTPAPDAGAACL